MTVEKPKLKQLLRAITTGARRQLNEPITIPSNYLKLAQSAGKITRIWRDCISLAEKLARVF